jgi:two-component system chemotaxis response regulator CheB
MNKKIRVLVVDDSAVMRRLLSEILGSDPEVEVVGTASDPYFAREQIKLLNPDVLTLDVEMPRMDGLTFLRNLMRLRPMPVVMCSSLTQQGADATLDAIELGAVDFIEKPKVAGDLNALATEILYKVKGAAGAKVRQLVIPADFAETRPVLEARPVTAAARPSTSTRIIAIGASTGGTEAIRVVLEGLTPESPGVVIAQHIPKAFSGSFAQRMNACSPLEVSEARDGLPILTGHAYIAPGDQHLEVVKEGTQFRCRLHDGELVNRHRPSVDVMFRSVAENVGGQAIGVILTGMGRDGAEGLKQMLEAGACTLAQDEATSVVWGMPGAAFNLGGVQSLHPLTQIAEKIQSLTSERTYPMQSRG